MQLVPFETGGSWLHNKASTTFQLANLAEILAHVDLRILHDKLCWQLNTQPRLDILGRTVWDETGDERGGQGSLLAQTC